MKNIFICLFALIAFTGCVDNEEEELTGGNIDIDLLPDSKPDSVINEKVFDAINLDYPGLEKVKEYYVANEYYSAAHALLEYYRNRTSVINPNINLMNTTITAFDQNVADQAVEHRFYVRNFKEKVEGDKEIYYSFDKDNKINWAFIPSGITDQEFKYQIHRHQWMLPQAKAYRVNRNEKYIESWKSVYADWSKAFPCPVGVTFPTGESNDINYQWKGLQVAERIISQIDIMAYFIQSKNFTPEWISSFLAQFAESVECIRLNYYTDSNILVTQAQAVAMAGILMPEFKHAEEWVTEGASKLGEQVKAQFLADGVHYELDPSYHVGAISDFYETYQIAKLNGKANKFPADYVQSLQLPAQFIMNIMYPDYSMENFNDTRSDRLAKSVLIKNFKKYAEEIDTQNQELLWVATEGSQGSKPANLTKAFPNAGYYILRDGWDKSSTMMILKNNNNPENKWHCQPDNGTFSLYRNGRNFFPDAGVYAYSGSDRTKYSETANHNTLTLMSKMIPNGYMKGKLLKMESQNNIDVLVTENQSYGPSIIAGQPDYTALSHRRSVFFVNKKFFVLVDEGVGGNFNSNINLNFHLCPIKDSDSDVIIDDFSNATPKVYGAHTAFSDNNNMMFRTFAETTTDYAAKPSVSSVSNDLGVISAQRKSYQITVRKPKFENGAARFITVLYPIGSGSEAESTSISAEFTDIQSGESAGTFHEEGTSVKVTINGQIYNLSYTLN